MSSGAHARVSSKDLRDHLTEHVLLVGKVESLDGSEAKFLTHDGAVIVHAGTGIVPLEMGGVYQVVGRVIDDSSLKAFTATRIPADDLPPADFMRRLLALRSGPAREGLFMREPRAE